MTRVLITGSTGLLGRALVASHLAAGDDVHTAQRGPSGGGGEHHSLDVTDRHAVEAVLRRVEPDLILHLAGESSLAAAEAAPARARATIVGGTENVLNSAACLDRTTAVVVASSTRAYARGQGAPITESHPLASEGSYATAKAVADKSTRAAAARGLCTAVLRLSHIYGPVDPRVSRIVPAAIEAALGGHPLVLRSSGDCRHDFLHVSDAVGAFTSVARRLLDRPDDVVGQAFNAGSGVAHSVFEVADVIGAAAGVALAVKSPVGAVPDTDCVLDSSRLCAAVGWVPTMPLAEGIADAVSAQQQMLVHAGRS